jgi:rod shape-determining protein MreB
MLGKRIGIDLGVGTMRVVVRGEAQILTDPSLVARHRRRGLVGAGLAAVEAAGAPETELTHPIRGGGVEDAPGLAALIQRAINRAAGRQRIFRPDVVIALCPAIGGDDRLTILDACARLGTRTVYLIDSPIAAVMGAGHSLAGSRAHLVADIGAGSVDVACVTAEGTIAGRTLPRGGEALRAAICRRFESLLGVAVEAGAGDDVIASLVTAGPHEERRMELGGVTGGPGAAVSVASKDVADLVDDHARRVAGAVREVIDETPATLRGEILAEGVILCGGGAALEGLERFVAAQAGCPARVAPDPQNCVIRGTQIAVESLDVLKRSFVYIR